MNFVKDTKQKVEMLKTMQDIFFGIPYKLFYQATKWEIAAVHGSGGLRCQKCMRSGASWRLPIHYHYVLNEEEKIYFPIYMSYSNHQWCIWKVYHRPIKRYNNISQGHMDPELGMTKLFLVTIACMCKNQISHSVWGTKNNQNR